MKQIRTILVYVSLGILGSLTLYRTLAEPTLWPQKLLGLTVVAFCLWYFVRELFGSGPPDLARPGREHVRYYFFWLIGSVFLMVVAYIAPDVPNLGRFFLYFVSGIGIVMSLSSIVFVRRRKT